MSVHSGRLPTTLSPHHKVLFMPLPALEPFSSWLYRTPKRKDNFLSKPDAFIATSMLGAPVPWMEKLRVGDIRRTALVRVACLACAWTVLVAQALGWDCLTSLYPLSEHDVQMGNRTHIFLQNPLAIYFPVILLNCFSSRADFPLQES